MFQMKFCCPCNIFNMCFCNFTYLRGTGELNAVIPALDLSFKTLLLPCSTNCDL